MHAAATAPAARAAAWSAWVSDRPRSLRGRELLACCAALSLLALLMCAQHVRAGGLYYDDWSLLALTRFPAHGGVLHSLWLDYGQRPLQVLYYAGFDALLGGDVPARLAVAGAALALEAGCACALLLRLGLAARDALAIAALLLAFPYSDSTWLWSVVSLGSIAIAACLIGALLALRALERRGWRARALHAASLVLYVASVAGYEIMALAACLAGLLYVRTDARRGRRRWLLDVCAVAATLLVIRALLPVDVATPSRMQSPGGLLAHAALIAVRGAQLIGAAALPLAGVDPWVGTALVAAVLASAVLALRRAPAGAGAERKRVELQRWLVVCSGGALLAAAGWLVYAPAASHYTPVSSGTLNRMNAAAALGVAVLLYGALALLARLAGGLARLGPRAIGACTAVLALALLGGYLVRSAADARAWDAAAHAQQLELADVRAALPALPQGAVVYAFDAPLTVAAGVPVIDTPLDLTSALRVSYGQRALLAAPLGDPRSLRCARGHVLGGGVAGAYGRSYLLDVRARAALALPTRAGCRALLRALAPAQAGAARRLRPRARAARA